MSEIITSHYICSAALKTLQKHLEIWPSGAFYIWAVLIIICGSYIMPFSQSATSAFQRKRLSLLYKGGNWGTGTEMTYQVAASDRARNKIHFTQTEGSLLQGLHCDSLIYYGALYFTFKFHYVQINSTVHAKLFSSSPPCSLPFCH